MKRTKAKCFLLLFTMAIFASAFADEHAKTVKVRHYTSQGFQTSITQSNGNEYLQVLNGNITGCFERSTSDPAPTVTLGSEGGYSVLTYANAQGSCCGYAFAYYRQWDAWYIRCEPACAACGCFYGICRPCDPIVTPVELITVGPE